MPARTRKSPKPVEAESPAPGLQAPASAPASSNQQVQDQLKVAASGEQDAEAASWLTDTEPEHLFGTRPEEADAMGWLDPLWEAPETWDPAKVPPSFFGTMDAHPELLPELPPGYAWSRREKDHKWWPLRNTHERKENARLHVDAYDLHGNSAYTSWEEEQTAKGAVVPRTLSSMAYAEKNPDNPARASLSSEFPRGMRDSNTFKHDRAGAEKPKTYDKGHGIDYVDGSVNGAGGEKEAGTTFQRSNYTPQEAFYNEGFRNKAVGELRDEKGGGFYRETHEYSQDEAQIPRIRGGQAIPETEHFQRVPDKGDADYHAVTNYEREGRPTVKGRRQQDADPFERPAPEAPRARTAGVDDAYVDDGAPVPQSWVDIAMEESGDAGKLQPAHR